MNSHKKNGKKILAIVLTTTLVLGTMMAAMLVPSVSAKVIDKNIGTFTYDFTKDGASCYEPENIEDGYLKNAEFTNALRMNYSVDADGMHFASGRTTAASAADSTYSSLWVKNDPYGAFVIKDTDNTNDDGYVVIRERYNYKVTVNFQVTGVSEDTGNSEVSVGIGQTTNGDINGFKAYKSARKNISISGASLNTDTSLTFSFTANSTYAPNNEKLGIYAGFYNKSPSDMNARAEFLIKSVVVEVTGSDTVTYDFIGSDGTAVYSKNSEALGTPSSQFMRNQVRIGYSVDETGLTIISGRSEEYQNGTTSAAFLVGDPDHLSTLNSRFVKMVKGKGYGVVVKYKVLNVGNPAINGTTLEEDPYALDPQISLGYVALNSNNKVDGAMTIVAKDIINRETLLSEGTDSDIFADGERHYMVADFTADEAADGQWLAISAGFKSAFNNNINSVDDCAQFLVESVNVVVKESSAKSLFRVAEYSLDGSVDVYFAAAGSVPEDGYYFADLESGTVVDSITEDISVIAVPRGNYVAIKTVDENVSFEVLKCGTAPYLPQNRMGEGAMYWEDVNGAKVTDWSAEGAYIINAKYPNKAVSWDFSNGEEDVYYTIEAAKNASTTKSTYSFGSDETYKNFLNIKDSGTASYRVELALSAAPGAGKAEPFRMSPGKYAIELSIKLSKEEEKGALRYYLADKNAIGQTGHKVGNYVIKNNIEYNNGEWTRYYIEFTVPAIQNCTTCTDTPMDMLLLCYSFNAGKIASDISLADIKIKKIEDDALIYTNAVGNAYSSIRTESGEGENYVSAGLRFRAHLEGDVLAKAEAADEAGFIVAPEKNTAEANWFDVSNAASGKIKKVAVKKSGMSEVVYDSGDGFKDYQLILTGLTKDGETKTLKDTNFTSVFYIKTGDTYEYFFVRSGSYKTVEAVYAANGLI